MEPEKKKKVSVFRFGVIHPLCSVHPEEEEKLEHVIQELSKKKWKIPYSDRTYISSSTIRCWLKKYKDSGNELSSLEPETRTDKGKTRAIDLETEEALVNLKRQNPSYSLQVLLKMAVKKNIISPTEKFSQATLYRLFQKYEIADEQTIKRELKRFEVEFPNELWQADCMHGPKVIVEGSERKSYLLAIIDDHSRLIVHAEFYLKENVENFKNCLKTAISKRGIPRKLYTDNGSMFRSNQLEYAVASLGIALLHTKPYIPEGKGKIERFYRTIRTCFIPLLQFPISLDKINAELNKWINEEYHVSIHNSTKEKPLERYCRHIKMIRNPEKDLELYFRNVYKRTVMKDKTVNLNGKIYEAPFEVVGKKVNLLCTEPLNIKKIEIVYNGKSYGWLIPLNPHLNSKIIVRHSENIDVVLNSTANIEKENLSSGKLFAERRNYDF